MKAIAVQGGRERVAMSTDGNMCHTARQPKPNGLQNDDPRLLYGSRGLDDTRRRRHTLTKTLQNGAERY